MKKVKSKRKWSKKQLENQKRFASLMKNLKKTDTPKPKEVKVVKPDKVLKPKVVATKAPLKKVVKKINKVVEKVKKVDAKVVKKSEITKGDKIKK